MLQKEKIIEVQLLILFISELIKYFLFLFLSGNQIRMEKRSRNLMLDLEQQSNTIFNNYKYEQNGLKPSTFFWKELVAFQRETPTILIPDTLIINEKQHPLLWIYTNSQARTQKNTNISMKDFINKITSFCSPNELTATIKRLTNKEGDNNFGNDVKLVNSRYLHNLSLQQLGDQVVCIQKYVKSHGDHAFICRTVFSKNSHSHCFLITNKVSYFDEEVPQNKRFLVTNPHSHVSAKKSTIVRSATGKNLNSTLPFLNEIVRYMRFQRGINLLELVGDFVKDEQGNWWLVNIKAFLIQQQIRRVPKAQDKTQGEDFLKLTDKEKYQKTKQCKYCQKNYLQSELTHKMTRKMLIQMDRYLLHMGKSFQWLGRSDANIDPHCLYQQYKICERCYRLYLQIQGLLEFQGVFLKRLGFQIEGQPKDLLMKLTNKLDLQIQSKDKEIHNLKNQIPQEISLGPNSSIITKNDYPIRNDETIHQMARYRFIIYIHELDELSGVKAHHNYYFQFSIFGSKFKLKLDLHPKFKIAPIKKLRVAYFFVQTSNESKSLQEYMTNNETLKINLICQNRLTCEKRNIGCLNLDTRQFLGSGLKKSFYKFLDVEDVGYGWGLQGSIGLVRTQQQVNTSRLILSTQDKLIYLPSQHYYLCEPLPEEWIDEISNKNQFKKMAQTMQTNDCMKIGIDTGEQFLPDQTNTIPKKVVKKIDLKKLISSQLRSYENKNK